MKKSRLFVTLLVMLVATSGFAQDSYRETLKEYIQLYGIEVDTKNIAQGYKMATSYLFKSGDVNLNQLTDRYMEDGLIDYMIDFMLPKMKEAGLTEERMKETISLLSTPEGTYFKNHVRQWTDAMKSEITSITTKIMDGDADPIQPKTGIDAKYIKKFKEFLDEQKAISHIESSFNMYSNYMTKLGEKMSQNLPDGTTEKMENLKAWMTANLPTIALNNAYGIMTEDDIDFAIANKMYSEDNAYSKLQDIMSSVNPMSFGFDMMTDYLQWMQDHGAELQEGAMDSLNHAKKWIGN